MAISLRSAIGSGELPLNPVQEDVYEGFSQATASPLQQGWHTASLGGAANSAYTKALMAKDAGDLEGFDANMAEAQALQQQAAGWAPEVRDYRQVNDLSSGLRYTAQGLGSAANSSLPSLVGGVAGGIGAAMIAARNPMMAAKTVGRLATAGGGVGAAIPGYDMEMEEAAGQAAQDEQIMATRSAGDILDAARVKGGINMLGEAVVPAMLMGKIGGTGLRQAFKSPTAALTALPGAIGQGMLTEGATEGAQNIVGQMTQNQLRRDPLDNIDYHEATNDALIGAMFGGGMGTVGGAADLAHRSMATVGQGAQDVANSDPVQQALAKGKELASQGADLASQGLDIAAEYAKKGVEFVAEDIAQINEAYAKDGIPGALAKAEDLAKRHASNLADNVESGVDKLTEIGTSYVQRTGRDIAADAEEITTNPYDKNNLLSTEEWMSIRDSRGDIASNLVDEFLGHPSLTGANKELLTRLSTPEGRAELKKDDKLQAQVGTIWKGLENHDRLNGDLNDIVSDLRKRQEETGKAMPSKQQTPEAKAAASQRKNDVANMLSSMAIDTTTVNKLSKLAEKGQLDEGALTKALWDRASEDEIAQLAKIGYVEKTDEEIIPAKNRKEKRALERANAETAQEAISNSNSNYIGSNISRYVSQAVEGTEYDTPTFRRTAQTTFEELVSGVANGTATHGDILRIRSKLEAILGEKGVRLVDIISDTAEFYSNRMDMKDVAEKIAGLRDRNVQQTTIESLDKLLANNGSATERRKATSEVLHELVNAYMKGASQKGMRDRIKDRETQKVTLDQLRAAGRMDEARNLENHISAQRLKDPFAAFKAAVKKHFGDKHFDRVETLVAAHLGEIRKEMKQEHIVTKTNNGGIKGVNEAATAADTDINDPDFNQDQGEWVPGDTALDTADQEIAATTENETGAAGDISDPLPERFYGQSAKEPGSYHDFPGAPLTTAPTYAHPQGEFASLKKDIEVKNNGARAGRVSVIDWAEQRAKAEGIDVETLLNDTAKEQIATDKETALYLTNLLGKRDLSRREGNTQKTHEEVKSLIQDQLKAIAKRADAYAAHRGNGRSFFADGASKSLAYVTTSPATGEIIQLDASKINRFVIGDVADEAEEYQKNTGGKAETFTNSIMTMKGADGHAYKVDFAGLLTSMVSHNQAADITGVGDKSIETDFLADLRVAFANVLGSLYVSNKLTPNDPLFARGGVQAAGAAGAKSTVPGGGTVQLPGIKFNPNLVIYRDEGSESEAPRVYTYGQVFGTLGENAARSEKVSATKDPLTKTELHAALSAKGDKTHYATNVLQNGTKTFALNPRALIKLMMDRHGIDPQTVLPTLEDTDGISAAMAGALFTEGLLLLARAGYTLNVDVRAAVLADVVVWGNQNFDTNFSTIAPFVGKKYTGLFDIRLDKIEAAKSRFAAATQKLLDLKKADKKAKVQKMGEVNEGISPELLWDAERDLESAAREMIGQQLPDYDKGNKALKFTKDEMENARMNNASEGATVFDKSAENLTPKNEPVERGELRTAKATEIAAAREGAPLPPTAQDQILASQTKAEAKRALKAFLKGKGASLSNKEKAALLKRVNAMPNDASVSGTAAQPVSTNVSTTPYEGPKLSFDKSVAKVESTTIKTSGQQSSENLALESTRARSANANRAAAAGRATINNIVAEANNRAGNKPEPVTNAVPTTVGPQIDTQDLIYKLETAELTVKQALAHTLPPVTEVIRAANKRFGEMSKWPTKMQSLVNAMERDPNDGGGGGTRASKQTTKGGTRAQSTGVKDTSTYISRILGTYTLPNGAPFFHVGKYGPVANAGFTYSLYDDGSIELRLHDVDLLNQGAKGSKSVVEVFSILPRNGSWTTAEVHTDGVAITAARVISKYRDQLQEVYPKGRDKYFKFKEGSFSNAEVRDAFRMLRDMTIDSGEFANVQQVAIKRGTGKTAGLPERMLTREQALRFSKQAPKKQGNTPSTTPQEAHARRLGDTVDMFIKDIVGANYSGLYTSKERRKHLEGIAKAMAEVSRQADNIHGSLAHEDWHALEDMLKEMGEEGSKILKTIHAGVMEPRTKQWIIKQLLERGESPTAEDGAFSQLNDPSEVAAFAFQFFVENGGKMTLPPRTRSLFEKISAFIKALAGLKEDVAKTESFFQFFDTGDFQKNMKNPLSVVKGLGETQREQYLKQLNEVVKPLRDLAFAAFGHTADRIKAMNIPAYSEILKRFQEGQPGYAGYAEEQRARMYAFANKYAAITEGLDPAKLTDEAKNKINGLIFDVEQYKKEAGAKGWDLKRAGFPPVFELKNIEGRLEEFKRDLRGYGGLKNTSEAELNDMVNQILYDGYARGNDSLFRDHPEKLEKWSSKDQTRQAFAYFKAATQAAEMSRAFKGTTLETLLAKGDEKASSSDKQVIRVFIDASMGRAGMNMSPELRKLFGAVTTAINISLLPFALFSQMVEPLQLAFRKNDVSSAVNSAFRGFRDLPRTFNSINAGVRADVWERAALNLGATTNAAAVNMMSEIMNEVPLQGKVDKLNNMFFRYIGMEQWARSMHVASTQNALEFIKFHSKTPNKDSSRLMEELGLKGVKVKFIKTALEEGNEKGGTIELPDINDPYVRAAVLRFVNESMAHPDPSTNTVWMNDPRFALLAHLKRFTFGFSYYINRRAMNDIKAGRYKELLPLAMFVPWKLATEGLKDMIKPGDEAYKANWTATDYIADSINKSGLTGRYGLGIDAGINMAHGGSGLEAVSPTAEMSGKLARAANEGHGWRTAIEQIPGGKLVTQ